MTDPVNIIVDLQSPFASSRNFSIPAVASLLSEDANDLWGSTRTRRVNKASWKDSAKQFGLLPADALYLSTAATFADHRNLKKVPEYLVWIRRDTPVGMVWTFNVGGNAAGDYKIKTNGVETASYTADGIVTAAVIRNNLVILYNAANPPQTAANAADPTGTVTADEAGVSFLLEFESPANVLTGTVTTPNVGIEQDMDAAVSVVGDQTFYAWTEASQSDGVILNAASWTQIAARRLLFFGQSNTTAIKQDVDTDVFSIIKAKGLGRTTGWWHPTDTEYLAAGLIGRCIAQPVGQINWAHKQISTVTPYMFALDAGVAAILEEKNVNRYDALELGSTLYGTMADGLFIDQVILKDVLEAGLRSRLLQALQSKDLIEYTVRGAEHLASVILGFAGELVSQGALVAGSVKVTVGRLEDIPQGDQKVRNWPLFKLEARAAGAINRIIDLTASILL